jgi:sensor histidine kinase YesM
MKSRGIIDLYLPSKVAYHVKIILASFLVGILFPLFREGKIWGSGSIYLVLYMIFQLELFLWMGAKFFSYPSPATVKESVKKAVRRLILFFAVAFILSALTFLAYMFFIYIINGFDLNQLIPNILRMEVKGFIIGAVSGYIFGSMIFFYYQWIDALKREKKLIEEQLIFKYETLKSQVNPHFLFNSLNTLSSLVYKNPELSDKFIGKLSSIYRYILENADADRVELTRELEFVKKYFDLQQVRDNGKIDLKINVENAAGFEILPISLQLLMENAFKHNAATRGRPLKMEILLNEKDLVIEFRNNYQPKIQMEGSSGIGLKNLAERIKLTFHRDLEIHQSDATFLVRVPVKLK